ncbi:hypothetical protein CROQUDRAFT_344226 [Cronartium quercuum f. sp. fusiforme G11]|uniref:Uncharacterized protein n=1 Tax=Cronartium quercuum f. sp. fusiforme G11 TaxID=708437 RepID=A0A9P6T6K0_9BASI|nr:hypothetical protein CROQUDRAFT_344226 [Cronartium quercuum f. sp. fusiforme G11]
MGKPRVIMSKIYRMAVVWWVQPFQANSRNKCTGCVHSLYTTRHPVIRVLLKPSHRFLPFKFLNGTKTAHYKSIHYTSGRLRCGLGIVVQKMVGAGFEPATRPNGSGPNMHGLP